MEIIQALLPPQLELARALLVEYVRSLPIDLGFQRIDRELELFPGDYTPPGGCFLLAMDPERAAGCVAMRRWDGKTCEMKRLYTRPGYRGQGLGRQLTLAVMRHARACGYTEMVLDTLPFMEAAAGLYLSLGFERTEPYYPSPIPGTLFMRRIL
ncbi:MAG TPA: GNAT family N-acetyltransferase [Archangium sp.]|uniref:GNAT family N-acetyltransferase n=1 Tax=Archangium sp. TaxID=1872627 RepID=UPI002E34F163|nr:GNAT family N-acetyltransferase [Archangium sp.]HEX5751344.1 GNAT family N-acetyltransferase [Archangium sp.]